MSPATLHTSRLHATLLMFSLLAMTACDTITSTVKPPEEPFDANISSSLGLQYNLPKANIRLVGGYAEKKNSETDKVESVFQASIRTKQVADLDAVCFARITTNAMFDEDTHLKVENGLLQSATSKPEDKTGETIIALAKTAIASAKVMANLPASAPASMKKTLDVSTAAQPFDVKINPFAEASESESYEKAKEKLAALGWDLHIEDFEKARASLNKEPANTPKEGRAGLLYRMTLPLTVDVKLREGWVLDNAAKGADTFQSVVSIPHPGRVCSIPLKRVFMSKRETSVVFVEGNPVEVGMKQGSPVLNFVGIPLKIAEAAAEAIPGIIQVHNKAPTDAVSAQANYLDAQARLLESQKKLTEAQKAAAESP